MFDEKITARSWLLIIILQEDIGRMANLIKNQQRYCLQ